MSKLISLETWRQDTFAEPRPTIRACQNWAKQGHIPGARKVGYLWFVDIETNKQASMSLVDKVLAS